tara:strand:- start:13510 stop:14178 length:669 start_codon:yes stop_codon:yes gene_type:complete
MNKVEITKLLRICIIPFLFVLIIFLIKIIELQFNLSFINYGVYPQKINGLKGVLFSPFIHKDLTHLLNNSYPILILGVLLFSVYKKIASEIFIWLFFISGFWLWIIGRPLFHVGASGIIYALASFLFVSGIIRKNSKLAAISMIVVFLYGSMIWGILPTNDTVSWEGHLSGFMAGILVALFYKNQGPKRKKYQWEIDEELEEERLKQESIKINYIIKKNKEI